MTLNITRFRWIWPGVIVCSAAVTGLFFFLGLASPFRLIITLWFLLVCPGMAFVRLMRFNELYNEWTLAIALSISLDAIVACLLLYTGFWSIELGLNIVIMMSILGAALQVFSTQSTFIPALAAPGISTANFTPTFISTHTATITETVTPIASRTAVADLIFADAFESGDLSAWSSNRTDGGALSVSSAAALTGRYGLQAVINDNNAIYVRDDSPNAETHYRARFYFNPNSISMANNNAHYLFYGYADASTVVLRIEFRFFKGNYQLRAALRNDSNSWKRGSWFTIADTLHFIEIDWRAATANGANNGGLTLWIDGAQRANLIGIDNDTRRIDRVRLGAVSGIDSGTRGTYYFDAFESHRQIYIGPYSALKAHGRRTLVRRPNFYFLLILPCYSV
jgi:hypothetical protein